MVDLSSELRYSPNSGADIFHAPCYIARLRRVIHEGYEMAKRRAFKWSGYPPTMDEPSDERRMARAEEASAIEHELRALAGRANVG